MSTKSTEPTVLIHANLTEIQDTNRVRVAVAICENKPVMDVIAYIHQEMVSNAVGPDAAYIRDKLEPSWLRVVSPVAPVAGVIDSAEMLQAYYRFFQLVKPGSTWDHKKPILKGDPKKPMIPKEGFGKFTCDLDKHVRYQYDIWSNIHYGYVGLACGLPRWDLLAGGGGAQIYARTVPDGYWSRRFQELGDADFLAAFDDPADQEAIKIGFELWDSHKLSMTTKHILDIVRERFSRLSTEVCELRCVKHK
ncbi:toxin 44 [Stigmatella aurantiaca]|uniref:Toxin 44 n=1 Tax=Stigmatella aurantiaca TaxID=41 RepID=A0A1H8G2I4_STIAU|nr:polymorphic toxin type 44 domain-containing protein [Stigmatella aurantiaca]SEN38321.1 toxin 44 [Stigmatella aurantiaca]